MLNVKSSEWCAILDGKLFIIYSELANQCDKNRKMQLAAEQTAWLKERNQLSVQAGKEFEGGTLEPFTYNVTFGRLTKERIEYLEKQLP